MAEITKAIAANHRLVADLVPVDIRKAIGQDELLDRIVHAEELSARSRAASDVTLRKGYASLARAVLRAQPRALTERRSAELVAKAAGLGGTRQADALRRQAQELLELHPPAPRRADAVAVAKAAKPEQVAIYDQAGNLVGLVDEAEIIRVRNPAGPDDDASVAKARAARRPRIRGR